MAGEVGPGRLISVEPEPQLCDVGREAQEHPERAGSVVAEGLVPAQGSPHTYSGAWILAQLGQLDEALALFRQPGAQMDVGSLVGAEGVFDRMPLATGSHSTQVHNRISSLIARNHAMGRDLRETGAQ